MGETAEVILHSMTLEDIETIYEIENQSFKTGWSFNDFKECVASQQHLKIVAEIDKKISAYAIIQTSKERNFYLLKFVVAPKWRGHGLGKTFLEALLKLISKWGGGSGIFTRQHKKRCGNSPV